MITRIYVNNYRCFENLAVDLADFRSALLIGKNGSGKSTLRQAFRVFQKICRGPNRVKEWINGGDFTRYRTERPMRFELDAVLGGRRYRYAIVFESSDDADFGRPVEAGDIRIAEESLMVDGVPVFTRRHSQVDLPGGATFGLDWHVAALPVIQDRKFKGELQTFKTYCASMILIAPVPQRMTGLSEGETFELQEDAGNIAAWLISLLRRKPEAYTLIHNYLKEVMPDFHSFENVPKGERRDDLTLTFQTSKFPEWFTVMFDRLSDGEKCFFLSAAIVAANQVAGPVFCFWDEPDNHLSLDEVGHFIVRLRKLVNSQGQFIATSHHPETIRKFSDETTLVFQRASHLEPTVVRPLSEIGYDGDLILSLLLGEVVE
ncbi:MAG: hypothetical protein BGO49_06655 [Planctomycetales bacterium 71-10]|nr:MAG: hypothetical protein BGO49_06655 [Planctomycetales bacterium 71-10]